MCRPSDLRPGQNHEMDNHWRGDIAWNRQWTPSIEGFHCLSMTPLQFASFYGLSHFAAILVKAGDLETEQGLFSMAPTNIHFEHYFRSMEHPALAVIKT